MAGCYLLYLTLVSYISHVSGNTEYTYNPDTDNVIIIDGGTCYNTDCSCRGECCQSQSLFDKFKEIYQARAGPATTPGYFPPADVTEDQSIGPGEDFNPGGAILCDHATNGTVVLKESFKYKGWLKYVRWLINYDCTDDGAAERKASEHNELRFGFFEPEPGKHNSFRPLGSIKLNRAQWHGEVLVSGKLNKTMTVVYTYTFTDQDIVVMGVPDLLSLEGRNFGFGWSLGGGMGYQKPKPAWDGQDLVAIYISGEFEPWDSLSTPSSYRSPLNTSIRREARHYNVRVVYTPYRPPCYSGN